MTIRKWYPTRGFTLMFNHGAFGKTYHEDIATTTITTTAATIGTVVNGRVSANFRYHRRSTKWPGPVKYNKAGSQSWVPKRVKEGHGAHRRQVMEAASWRSLLQ